MTLWYLPLEPMDMRYTEQWMKWFEEMFKVNGIDYHVIPGEMAEFRLDNVSFLDMKNTFVWKFTQLAKLFEKKIKDRDIIFIPDGEFPGIEAIEYFKKFYDLDICVVEIWHAGTYDRADLTSLKGLGAIGKHLEEVWMAMADLIFLGSNYHKEIICRERLVEKNKLYVSGLPVDVYGVKSISEGMEKKKRIVFTGRLTWEKGYDVVKKVRKRMEVYATHEMGLKKDEYYKFLAGSSCVFSPARQETFGYGVIEGMSAGCVPVVPDDLSYREYVPEEWRYEDEDEMFELLSEACNCGGDEEMYINVEKYQYEIVINRMIDVIEENYHEYLY